MGWLWIKFGKVRGCAFPWQMSTRVSNLLSDLRVWFLRDALTNNTSCLRVVLALGGTFSTHCGWMWERQGGNDAVLVLTGVSRESMWEAPQSPIALKLPHGTYTSPFLNSIWGQQGSWKLGQTWCRAMETGDLGHSDLEKHTSLWTVPVRRKSLVGGYKHILKSQLSGLGGRDEHRNIKVDMTFY